MPPTHSRLRRTLTLALALGAIALTLLPVSRVDANGAHVGAWEVFSGPAGPYDISVVTTPRVGNLHITIFVSPVGSAAPVSDAMVHVSGRGPRSAQSVDPTLSVLSLTGWYGVDLLVEEAGGWVFTVTVESPLGEAVVDIPIEVEERGNVNWGVLGAVAFLVVVAAWLALERRWRKTK